MYPLSKRLRALQARARRYVDAELIPWEVHAEMHEGEIPPEVRARHKALAKRLGLWNTALPVKHGGNGRSALDDVIAQEQLGRATNALGWVIPNTNPWMVEVASARQMRAWVKPTIQGARAGAYAITEEGAGSDVDAIQATVERRRGGYVLNGVKWHVTSANKADYFIFQGKLTGGRHKGEHVLVLVDKDTPGIRTVRSPAYTHNYASHHPILAFEDVVVPAANLVGREGGGMAWTYAWFREERLGIASRCCGAADRLIEEATAFAKGRVQFGQPIAENQAIQFMLADSMTELWAARLMTYQCAEAIERGADVKASHAQCSMVKLYASEMANRVADRAVQIFGGRGYMRENVAERFFRELRVDRIWEGTSEIQRLIIANGLYKRGLAPLVG
ncbi:MAG: acyl-CoA dehydrogenase [Alphaproteobacteria bacterium]|nr:acyl-CoA dehydrogenase [Alphaproteobacteria bacterium]